MSKTENVNSIARYCMNFGRVWQAAFDNPSPGDIIHATMKPQKFFRATIPLSRQINHLRWLVPLFALALVIAHQVVEHLWFVPTNPYMIASEIFVYGLVGPAVMWLALGWTRAKVARKESADAELLQLNHRIAFLLRVNQRLSETPDEEKLAHRALELPGEITPTIVGCALIRFDEHRQPMPAVYRGVVDENELAAWHQHLASSAVRERCAACQTRAARADSDCPVFARAITRDAGSIVCLALARDQREFGILGLFLAENKTLTREERDLLDAVVAEIAIAFENLRLRTRELATFYQVNAAMQQRLDFDGLMARILAQTLEASNAQAGLLFLRDARAVLIPRARAGDWARVGNLAVIESLAHGALREANGAPIVATLHAPDARAILCAPMIADAGALGVIVLASARAEMFAPQETRLVAAIARQAALLAENARLYTQLEHHAILAERGRLAREMHDGLAQTLGLLKMRASQIARWIENGEAERARDALRELAETANDAYRDLRATLDDLRATDADLPAQIRRIVAEFEQDCAATVILTLEDLPPLDLSAQAHLIRIVQESLTNIRKHARARQVRIALTNQEGRAELTIEDDGQGFDAARDQPATRHGLRVMRERADLLGAEFQIVSAPGEGTRVRLELPVSVGQISNLPL